MQMLPWPSDAADVLRLTLASCCSEAKPSPKTVLARLSAHWPNFCDVFVKVMFGVMVLLMITWKDKVTVRDLSGKWIKMSDFQKGFFDQGKRQNLGFLFGWDKFEQDLKKLHSHYESSLFNEQRTMPYCETVHSTVNRCCCCCVFPPCPHHDAHL